MAHGYGAAKHHGIEPVAEAFAEGFVVLRRDHRGFGDRGGNRDTTSNLWQQITDWRRAISYLQDRPEVDKNRVGLWGTSFAGGRAIVLGATDRRLGAVVVQVLRSMATQPVFAVWLTAATSHPSTQDYRDHEERAHICRGCHAPTLAIPLLRRRSGRREEGDLRCFRSTPPP